MFRAHAYPEDPLGGVWETHLVPLLARAPDLVSTGN